jgi:diamine N-acetyltransferase
MIALRPLQPADIPIIKAWPPYPPAFAMLDYALRDRGWLDEYTRNNDTEILIAEVAGSIAGFAILAREAGGSAEFRIALHPDRLGQGLGKAVALLAIGHDFNDPDLQRIRLIVRKNNPRAEQLYRSLRFHCCGECVETIGGEPVAFNRMELERSTFLSEKD